MDSNIVLPPAPIAPDLPTPAPAPLPKPDIVSAPPAPPAPRRSVIPVAIMVVVLVLAATGLYFYTHRSVSYSLPYETAGGATTPKEKFIQILSQNPVYAQINMVTVPTAPVGAKNSTGADSVLSLKAALTNTDNTKGSAEQQSVFSLSGTLAASPSGAVAPFSLKGSSLDLAEGGGDKAISDLILNGSIAGAALDDETQDAVHISLTQSDADNSYLKINLSDNLELFLGGLMNRGSTSGTSISVDTNTIWPFLGNYLHIPLGVEQVRFGGKLSAADQTKVTEIRGETASLFQKTLGDIPTYVTISQSADSAGATSFTGIVDKGKLAATIVAYLNGLEQIRTSHVADLTSICTSTAADDAAKAKCVTDYSGPAYVATSEVTNNIANLLTLFTFSPISATIDNSSLEVTKFAFNITLANKPAVDGSWQLPLPLSTFTLSMNTQSIVPESKPIIAPPNFVEFLSANNTDSSVVDGSYQENSIQGLLYRANRAALLASYTEPVHVCAGLTGSQYCLDMPSLWTKGEDNSAGDDSLLLSEKSVDTTDPKSTTIFIRQTAGKPYMSKCVYPGDDSKNVGINMVKYDDVTTKDGVHLRLSEPVEDPGFDTLYYVCGESGGAYYNMTSYGDISVDPGSRSYDDIAKDTIPVFASLVGGSATPLSVNPSPVASPSPIIADGSAPAGVKTTYGNDTFVSLYGAGPGDDGVCNTTSSYLQSQYSVDAEAIFSVPSGRGVCIVKKSCAVCTSGKLGSPTADLSACPNQPCD